MSGKHRGLVVEDDRLTAEDLAEILKSLGCDSVTTDNKYDALAALQAGTFCFILLDLEIKLEPGSIKGHTEHGNSLLREIRQAHADHPGRCHWLPILIVSGFARERLATLGVMKDGANDVILKPFNGREVSDAVRRALDLSGRSTHEVCGRGPTRRTPPVGDKILLAIPADRIRRRTRVMVGSQPIELPDSSLKVLLHLMVAYEGQTTVHKTELGAREEQGFRGVSILREALKPALGEGVDIIGNDYQGNYQLKACIVVGDCDTERLVEIGDTRISVLAQTLRKLLDARGKKSLGNS